jgi:hypothetical protein
MAEKTEIKEHIAAMKVKRDDAIARQAHDELKQIRRGIPSTWITTPSPRS